MNTETNYASRYYADLSMEAEAIDENVRNYPVSSVARFLRLCHLKNTNDPRFEEEAKKTGIYLNNPYWMEFQLSRWDREPEIHEDSRVNLPAGEVENSEIEVLNEANQSFDNDLFVNEDPNKLSDEKSPETPGIMESKTEDERMTLLVNEPVSGVFFPENGVAESPVEEVVTEQEANVGTERPDDVVEPISENKNLVPTLNEPISEKVISQNEVAESALEESVTETEANIEKEKPDKGVEPISENRDLAPPVTGQITENLISENEVAALREREIGEPVTPLADEPQNEVSGESETIFKKEESVFNPKAPDVEEARSAEATFNSTTDTEEENDFDIPFEPLHTVDYFASQGIRLTEEALNDDQLGKQVKSFTAWLKSMKKLHPGQLPEQNEVIEKLIQASSEVSNKSANVLTEAMAEVLIKQGKSQKAIEMYEKLSLLNPSKSAYFAAKIESLKII